MNQQYFITGTDTDVGKTLVSSALLAYFSGCGYRTLGFKPISAGCIQSKQGLINQDAQWIQKFSSVTAPLSVINPIAYQPAIAPHIAAELTGDPIDFSRLTQAYQQLSSYAAQIHIIEGAGGWYLPINDNDTLNQWVEQQAFNVILVVGMKLGCLNHALLTSTMIAQQGLNLVGWVANSIDPQMAHIEDNIETLKQYIQAPLLAHIPYYTELNDLTEICQHIHFDLLLDSINT